MYVELINASYDTCSHRRMSGKVTGMIKKASWSHKVYLHYDRRPLSVRPMDRTLYNKIHSVKQNNRVKCFYVPYITLCDVMTVNEGLGLRMLPQLPFFLMSGCIESIDVRLSCA